MMFSIADMQTPAEPEFEEDAAEGEQENGEQPLTSYPIRVAFAVTKVRTSRDVSSAFDVSL